MAAVAAIKKQRSVHRHHEQSGPGSAAPGGSACTTAPGAAGEHAAHPLQPSAHTMPSTACPAQHPPSCQSSSS
jgi:hypothetical protein